MNEDLQHGAEIGGLGVLAAPSALHMAEGLAHRNPGRLAGMAQHVLGARPAQALMHNAHPVELAGLGILAAPSAAHFGAKLLGRHPAEKVGSVPPSVLAFFLQELARIS